jgi:hypothetical protein
VVGVAAIAASDGEIFSSGLNRFEGSAAEEPSLKLGADP